MPRFTAEDGTSLFYSDEGEGLPLLCLAGLTRSGTDFDYLAPHLAGKVRLIRMDYRGRGRSDWTGPATYTVQTEARDAMSLLGHLGLPKVALLGTSRGGLVGLVLAITAGDRLRGICFNDIGPELDPDGLRRIADYIGRNPPWRSYAEAVAGLPRAAPGFDKVPAARWEQEARHHFAETPEGLRIRYDPSLREAVMAMLEGPPAGLWPFFDALAGLPLGIIRGANSDLLSFETYARMRHRRPDAIAAEVPGRAHVPFLDEPESLAVIHRFVEACR